MNLDEEALPSPVFRNTLFLPSMELLGFKLVVIYPTPCPSDTPTNYREVLCQVLGIKLIAKLTLKES